MDGAHLQDPRREGGAVAELDLRDDEYGCEDGEAAEEADDLRGLPGVGRAAPLEREEEHDDRLGMRRLAPTRSELADAAPRRTYPPGCSRAAGGG